MTSCTKVSPNLNTTSQMPPLLLVDCLQQTRWLTLVYCNTTFVRFLNFFILSTLIPVTFHTIPRNHSLFDSTTSDFFSPLGSFLYETYIDFPFSVIFTVLEMIHYFLTRSTFPICICRSAVYTSDSHGK